MIQLHAEVAVSQLSKAGEELCGDTVEVVRTPTDTIIVISDGLGSGVKANILATLTTKIASSMLRRGIPLEDVVNTITATLPVCRQRKIAYSTLHIIKISAEGLATVVEFDCPTTFLKRSNHVVPFPVVEKIVGGKLIKEGQLLLQENDIIVAVSDGVIHAGIGGLLKLGWGWQGIAEQLNQECPALIDSESLSSQIIRCCAGYYLDRAGDDSTVVAVKIRRPLQLTLLTGPPANNAYDDKVICRFLAQPGKKVIAGGTTANIVSRITGRSLKVDLTYHDPDIPPTGHMEGIDLVTEGVLTLNAAVDRIRNSTVWNQQQDGASLLARILMESDQIDIIAGTAVNPAHQNPNFPTQINIKAQVLAQLQSVLKTKGKQVSIEWV